MEGLKAMTKLNVLYEDNHVIVVEKLANILSQGDDTKDVDMLMLVKQYIKAKYHKPGKVYVGLVHRLDRPVGGLMVLAKTSKAAKRLADAMQRGQFKKEYVAVITNKIPKDEDTLIDYLVKDGSNTKVTDAEHGKIAKLSYQVLKRKGDLALVKILLETGRHHQIRVQFASRGYPLYGDQRYGKQDKEPIALFATGLSFYHPVTKEWLTFTLEPRGKIWQL